MDNGLISVIVPVFKVEKYLNECVQSLIDQTYSDLEIILVDDGSPDDCPLMCDSWAQKDSRIRVIHKTNGGLSSARNKGLEAATGDYISFVDSDDYFDKRMYEKLYEGITRSPSIGISAIKFYKLEDDKVSIYNPNWDTKKDVLIKAEEFGILAMKQVICHAATNKLYRRDLLANVRFREGRLNEDTLFAFDLSKEVVKMNVDMWDLDFYAYYYRMRQDSICHAEIPIEIPYMENLQIMFHESDNKMEKSAILRVYYSTVFMFCRKMLTENPTRDTIKNVFFKKYRIILQEIRYVDVVDGYGSINDFISYHLLKYSPLLLVLGHRFFRFFLRR